MAGGVAGGAGRGGRCAPAAGRSRAGRRGAGQQRRRRRRPQQPWRRPRQNWQRRRRVRGLRRWQRRRAGSLEVGAQGVCAEGTGLRGGADCPALRRRVAGDPPAGNGAAGAAARPELARVRLLRGRLGARAGRASGWGAGRTALGERSARLCRRHRSRSPSVPRSPGGRLGAWCDLGAPRRGGAPRLWGKVEQRGQGFGRLQRRRESCPRDPLPQGARPFLSPRRSGPRGRWGGGEAEGAQGRGCSQGSRCASSQRIFLPSGDLRVRGASAPPILRPQFPLNKEAAGGTPGLSPGDCTECTR